MLWKWVYYTQRCIWEWSCSHRSLLGGRDIQVGVWRMSRTQPGRVREEDPVVLWHRKESTHWRDRKKAGVSEAQGLWGERGDDAGPRRPRGRTFIYPKRMEETITVLKAGEWGDERYSLEERCQFHGRWTRQGQDCRRRYLGGSSPTRPVRYGVGEVVSRTTSRCAAGWQAPAFLEPGTPEVTGLGRNITDKGEDPRWELKDDSPAVWPCVSQAPHVFFFEKY